MFDVKEVQRSEVGSRIVKLIEDDKLNHIREEEGKRIIWYFKKNPRDPKDQTFV